jgi:hypothetical protein
LATGNDGNLEKRVGVFEIPSTDSMAGFVICNSLLVFRCENQGLPLETTNDSLDGLFEMEHLN